MLLALALYASTAHAGILAGFAGRQALPTRTRRTTTSSSCTTTGRRILREFSRIQSLAEQIGAVGSP
jgi:hypothetical protein